MANSSRYGWARFETALGFCEISWNTRAITRIRLPASRDGQATAVGKAGDPELFEPHPPAWVREATRQIADHLDGRLQDFANLPLEMGSLIEFDKRVYQAARAVKPGDTITYGELAAQAGSPGAAQAVGQALARNPFPIVVPCHRVLAANGKPGGFSAPGGVDTKAALLAIEGARIPGGYTPSLFK